MGDGKKITKKQIVFICNQMETNIMLGLQHAISRDARFNFTIVAAECVGTSWSPSYSQKQIEEGLLSQGIEFTSGADLDLNNFRESVFLTSTPYDIYLPDKFKSENIIRYGYLVNIGYGVNLLSNVGLYAEVPGSNPYLERCSYVFVDEDSPSKVIDKTRVGSAKVFFYNDVLESNRIYRNYSSDPVVSWKPRWTLNFDSTLFSFLLEFHKLTNEIKGLKLILIEHPLLRSKLRESGKLDYFENWESQMFETGRYSIASKNESLIECFKSDIFVADISSTIYEFSFTGKPILYTSPDVPLNNYGKRVTKVCYKINSPNELRDTILKLLNGKDLLKTKRRRLLKKQQARLGKPYDLILNYLSLLK